MPLQDTIADIQNHLKSGGYPNEDEITRKVVMRLLGELGWDTYGPQVYGQYAVKNGPDKSGRVDVALLANERDPDIFVEVKQYGGLPKSNAVAQVFNYAWHDNVPFLVVTDGQEWHFYLSRVGKGSDYENRKVYSLDLIKNDITNSEHQLQRYLSHKEVAKGNALRNAQSDYESATNMRKAENAFPIAWQQLLEEKGKVMLKLLSEKVENICGCRPDPEKLRSYLRGLGGVQAQSQPQLYSPPAKANHSKTYQPTKGHRKSAKPLSIMRVIFPDGTEICESRAVDTLVEVLHKIGYERVQSVDIKCQGFPFVLKQNPNPGDSRWRDSGYGYFVCVNTSTDAKIKILNKVAQQLGIALKIEKTPRQ